MVTSPPQPGPTRTDVRRHVEGLIQMTGWSTTESVRDFERKRVDTVMAAIDSYVAEREREARNDSNTLSVLYESAWKTGYEAGREDGIREARRS